jgi:hypothetical protein
MTNGPFSWHARGKQRLLDWHGQRSCSCYAVVAQSLLLNGFSVFAQPTHHRILLNDYRELRLDKLKYLTGLNWNGRRNFPTVQSSSNHVPLPDSQFVHLAAVYEGVSLIGLARTQRLSQSESLLHRSYITAWSSDSSAL